MTNQQNKTLHGLLTSTGYTAEKQNLVLAFTQSRSDSSRDLTETEAAELIVFLKTKPVVKTVAKVESEHAGLIRTATYQFRQLGYVVEGKPDWVRINDFLATKTTAKKRMNKMTAVELTTLITQLKTIVRKWKKS